MLTRAQLLTIGIAGIGVAAFMLLRLPLPWLLGPMFACLAAALPGARLRGLPRVSGAMRAVLGVAVGASITPELFDRIGAMAVSVAFVPAFVLVIGAVGYPYFRWVCGFNKPTAYFAAMPGGLQDMLVLGIEAGGDARALSLVHATRVLAIVTIMPVILTFGWGLSFNSAPGASLAQTSVGQLATLVVCAVIGVAGARRIGLFGASILGPMAVTAAASLAGLVTTRPPAEAILAAQFFIGMGVGAMYSGVTLAEIRRIVTAAIGYCFLLAMLSVGFAESVHFVTGAPQADAMLAFAPGGQGEMLVLAFVSGADLTYVVTHHLVRLLVVILGAPLASRLLG